jgi:hypothetical protein
MPKDALPQCHVQAQNFSRFTLGCDFNRPAANFTIGRESLRRDAGIDSDIEVLTAERALNGFADFHEDALYLAEAVRQASGVVVSGPVCLVVAW